MRIPLSISYNQTIFPSLSSEEIEKLDQERPSTIFHAQQVSYTKILIFLKDFNHLDLWNNPKYHCNIVETHHERKPNNNNLILTLKNK